MIFHGEPISGRFILFLISKIIFVSSTHIYIYIRKEKMFRVKNNLVRFYTLVSGIPNPVSNQESVEVGPCIELNKCWTWTLNPAVCVQSCFIILYHCCCGQSLIILKLLATIMLFLQTHLFLSFILWYLISLSPND